MRKFLSAAFLGLALAGLAGDALLAQPVGPPNEILCSRFFVINAVGATSITQFVAGAAGQTNYICGYEIGGGAAAATFQINSGTGTNCNANTTPMTPVYNIPINGQFISRASTLGQQAAIGHQLCYTTTGAGPLSAVIYYGSLR